MSVDRRKFLKYTGLAVLGATVKPIETALASAGLPEGSQVAGSRLAMVIDLRKCHAEKDCTLCVDACHKYHNVPDFDNPKDEIKWIWKETFHHAFHEQEHQYLEDKMKHGPAVVLCNHCDNPPCVRVCPTQATWKREEDGIVMMDWHRCIGCRYCVVACPYGSRSFNWRDPRPKIKDIQIEFPTRMRGVVEKCTFCEERLSKGLIPICVESCRVNAIAFGDLEDPDSEVRCLLSQNFTIRRKPALGTQPQIYYIV